MAELKEEDKQPASKKYIKEFFEVLKGIFLPRYYNADKVCTDEKATFITFQLRDSLVGTILRNVVFKVEVEGETNFSKFVKSEAILFNVKTISNYGRNRLNKIVIWQNSGKVFLTLGFSDSIYRSRLRFRVINLSNNHSLIYPSYSVEYSSSDPSVEVSNKYEYSSDNENISIFDASTPESESLTINSVNETVVYDGKSPQTIEIKEAEKIHTPINIRVVNDGYDIGGVNNVDFSENVTLNIQIPQTIEATDYQEGTVKLGTDEVISGYPIGVNESHQLSVDLNSIESRIEKLENNDGYSLPKATETSLGGVMLGAESTNARIPLLTDNDGRAYVTLPESSITGGFVPQVSSLDDSFDAGAIVQYSGNNTDEYINGYFYKRVDSSYRLVLETPNDSVYDIQEDRIISLLINNHPWLSLPAEICLSRDESNPDNIIVSSGGIWTSCAIEMMGPIFAINVLPDDVHQNYDMCFNIEGTGQGLMWKRIDVLPNLNQLHYILTSAERENIPDVVSGGTLTAEEADKYGIYIVKLEGISEIQYAEYFVVLDGDTVSWEIFGTISLGDFNLPGYYSSGNYADHIETSPVTKSFSIKSGDNEKMSMLENSTSFWAVWKDLKENIDVNIETRINLDGVHTDRSYSNLVYYEEGINPTVVISNYGAYFIEADGTASLRFKGSAQSGNIITYSIIIKSYEDSLDILYTALGENASLYILDRDGLSNVLLGEILELVATLQNYGNKTIWLINGGKYTSSDLVS